MLLPGHYLLAVILTNHPLLISALGPGCSPVPGSQAWVDAVAHAIANPAEQTKCGLRARLIGIAEIRPINAADAPHSKHVTGLRVARVVSWGAPCNVISVDQPATVIAVVNRHAAGVVYIQVVTTKQVVAKRKLLSVQFHAVGPGVALANQVDRPQQLVTTKAEYLTPQQVGVNANAAVSDAIDSLPPAVNQRDCGTQLHHVLQRVEASLWRKPPAINNLLPLLTGALNATAISTGR